MFVSLHPNELERSIHTHFLLMALNLNKNLKLYHNISEVAAMFGLNESTLRYWEKEFPFLRPKTAGSSLIRQYSEKDIEQVRLINNLVRERGFKIAAARKVLSSNRKGAEATAIVMDKLKSVRDELTAMKHQLDLLV